MKTTKGGKAMNPTDAYRKELRKKELKRNKKERKKVREVGILKKDPEAIRDQIQKLEVMKADGALDKARKHKKRQLEDTLNLVLKKRKEYEEKMREKGEMPVMFSHLGPPRRRATTDEDKVKHPKPEDSVYYHPTLNPTGAPPPGKPPMYKSSVGPRAPLSASTGAEASTSQMESEVSVAAPPPPPLAVSLPGSDQLPSDDSAVPSLPPPASGLPKLASESSTSLPPSSIPPPPPGPSLKENIGLHPVMPPPPPPPIQQSTPTQQKAEKEDIQNGVSESETGRSGQVPVLPPPPPPPGLPAKQQSAAVKSDFSATIVLEPRDLSKMIPPPPPRPPPPGPIRFPLAPNLQPDVLPPGVHHIPPPPLDMRPPPPPPIPGIPGRPLPPGMLAPLLPRPPFPALHGPIPMFRPPLVLGQPVTQEDDIMVKPQKPSYVKSAASTVVKRPLAQHNPELTSMVPASVRVRRETTALKAKSKAQISLTNSGARESATSIPTKSESGSTAGTKPQSIDDSYMAFLEDMKALGALDG